MQRRDMLKTLAAGATTLGAAASASAVAVVRAASLEPERKGKPIDEENVQFWSETSLKRIFPTSEPGSAETLELTTARNAQLSFQVCLRNMKPTAAILVNAAIEAPEGWTARVRRVGYVPIAHFDTGVPMDELDGIGHVPGFVPDPLFPAGEFLLGPAECCSFWITLKVPADAKVGVQKLVAKIITKDEYTYAGWTAFGTKETELPIEVDVRELVIERRKDFPATHWISADSIWEYYKIEPFSERFWELADAYIANITAHNLNVIYSPIFNARHEILERPAQLLKVRRVAEDKYEFDFSDVRRWIQLAKKHNADHVEWTHFFTPAPTSGKHPQRIFERWGNEKIGKMLWAPEISSTSDTYRRFLEQFLPQFKQVLEEEGALEMSLFHCADEPDGEEQMADYRKARLMLRELAPWIKVIDAMSEPQFAVEKLCEMPVPSIVTAPQFAAAGCDAWVYYCCGPRGSYLQRLLDTPLPKQRMAGWLFYKLKAKGFLHWGHNYWFVFCTGIPTDPFTDTTGKAWPGMPHGDTFVVYPGPDGPIDSIRWEVLAESLQDYAMLQTAGVDPDDPLFDEIASYEHFPKKEVWIQSATDAILSRKKAELKS